MSALHDMPLFAGCADTEPHIDAPAVAAPTAPAIGTSDAQPSRRPARAQRLLAVCNLGSGSGGNCTVLRLGEQALLIDAGFGPRTTRQRLAQAGLTLENVHALCLTHLDRDHFRPSWPDRLREHGIRVLLHRWHLPELRRIPGGAALEQAGLVEPFDRAPIQPLPELHAHTYRCQHDRQGTISYRFHCRAGTVGYATDLGHVPPALIEHLAGVDLLALECNYDPYMTIHSSRPAFVNRRNMSDSGHLSNDQALEAAQRIEAASPGRNPRQLLLLHRSSQCNHPVTVQRTFARDARLAGRLILTDQRRRTRWLRIKPQRAVLRRQMLINF